MRKLTDQNRRHLTKRSRQGQNRWTTPKAARSALLAASKGAAGPQPLRGAPARLLTAERGRDYAPANVILALAKAMSHTRPEGQLWRIPHIPLLGR